MQRIMLELATSCKQHQCMPSLTHATPHKTEQTWMTLTNYFIAHSMTGHLIGCGKKQQIMRKFSGTLCGRKC